MHALYDICNLVQVARLPGYKYRITGSAPSSLLISVVSLSARLTSDSVCLSKVEQFSATSQHPVIAGVSTV